MPELILTQLQPGQRYTVQVVAKDENGQTAQSNVLVFNTPSATLTANNSVVQQYLYSSAGIYSASNMFINGSGIFAYRPGQALSASTQTVAIEANTGNAYFAGTIFAQSGSIGGYFIGPSSLYGGSGNSFVGLSTTGTYSIFAGATASTGTGALFSVTPAGNITAVSGSIGGWTLDPESLSNARVGFFAPLNPSGSVIAIYAGSAGSNRTSAPFRVDYAGNLVATSASITGNINATSGSFSGNISASTGTIGGFLIGGSSLSATGVILSSASGLNLGSGSFTVNQSGQMVAQSASIVGRITAQSGSITGDLAISSAGRLIAQTDASNYVQVSGAGIMGVDGGLPVFTLPSDGTPPTIGGFQVVQTGLVGVGQTTIFPVAGTATNTLTMAASAASTLWVGMSASGPNTPSALLVTAISGSVVTLSGNNTASFTNGSVTFTPNANLVVGTSASNNITIRGKAEPSLPPAIFTRINNVPTTDSSGTGFYVGQDGKVNIGNKLKWDGSLLTVEGSGSFSGSISASAGYIGGSTGWAISSNSILNPLGAVERNFSVSASSQIFSDGNVAIISTGSSNSKIYVSNVTDAKNYAMVRIGKANSALEMYRRQFLSTVSYNILSLSYDGSNYATASINSAASALSSGQQIIISGIPTSSSYTQSASSSRIASISTSSVTSNIITALTSNVSGLPQVGSYIVGTNISGSTTKILSITASSLSTSGDSTTDYALFELSSTVSASSTTASYVIYSPTILTLTGTISSSISIFDSVIGMQASGQAQISEYNSGSIVITSPTGSAGSFTGSFTNYPNGSDFNGNFTISSVSGSTVSFSVNPINSNGLAIGSGSVSITGATLSTAPEFAGYITTQPFINSDGHIMTFLHEKGPDGTVASGGWPSRNDYATGASARRIIQPNIMTRATAGTIELNGSWMSDGISKLVLADGYNNAGVSLSSWYDTSIGFIGSISMAGYRSRYSSFWTGSTVRSGGVGVTINSQQGPYQTTITVSGASGVSGSKVITVPPASIGSFAIGQEIVSTNNTAASGIGAENQIVALTSGTPASVTLSYALTASFNNSSIQVYTPDRRKLELNSSGDIYVQSDENININSGRYFSTKTAQLSLSRNDSGSSRISMYADYVKYGTGYFDSGVMITKQNGWMDTSKPLIAFTPFDNYGNMSSNPLYYKSLNGGTWYVDGRMIVNSSSNSTTFKKSGAVTGTGNSWAAPWKQGSTTNVLSRDGTDISSTASIYYQQVGRTVNARYYIAITAASGTITGTHYVDFPVDAALGQRVIGTARLMRGSGTDTYFVGAAIAYSGQTFTAMFPNTSGGGNSLTWTNAVPPGQSNQDFVEFNITYEAAQDA